MRQTFPSDLQEKYDILEQVGRGAFGSVFVAVQRGLARQVVVKIMHQRPSAADEMVERFFQEARMTASLIHPNIVKVLDFGRGDGQPWIVYEHIKGATLSDKIKDRRLPLDESLAISIQVASALGEAHSRGILHRDIKPLNILQAGAGEFKVIDFGIAKSLEESRGVETQDGVLLGTPDYISPEQINGETLSVRSDLYSLGVVMYELFTGFRPFEGHHPIQVMSSHLTVLPKSMLVHDPQIPVGLDHVVLRCLEKIPDRRFDSASEIKDLLEWIRVDPEAATRALAEPARSSGSDPVVESDSPGPGQGRRSSRRQTGLEAAKLSQERQGTRHFKTGPLRRTARLAARERQGWRIALVSSVIIGAALGFSLVTLSNFHGGFGSDGEGATSSIARSSPSSRGTYRNEEVPPSSSAPITRPQMQVAKQDLGFVRRLVRSFKSRDQERSGIVPAYASARFDEGDRLLERVVTHDLAFLSEVETLLQRFPEIPSNARGSLAFYWLRVMICGLRYLAHSSLTGLKFSVIVEIPRFTNKLLHSRDLGVRFEREFQLMQGPESIRCLMEFAEALRQYMETAAEGESDLDRVTEVLEVVYGISRLTTLVDWMPSHEARFGEYRKLLYRLFDRLGAVGPSGSIFAGLVRSAWEWGHRGGGRDRYEKKREHVLGLMRDLAKSRGLSTDTGLMNRIDAKLRQL